MLREIAHVRQIAGEPPRRWFCSDDFDLIVWHDDSGAFWGFQLCYDLRGAERALSWSESAGYAHTGVDEGDSRSFRHKGTPILVADGSFDADTVGARFRSESAGLPPDLAEWVAEKIAGYRA